MNRKLEEWIVEADITGMQKAMESGEITSEDLVQAYLNRIHQYDSTINSILEVNPDAIAIARSLDREREDKGSRGMLHGIPILLKDNIDTHDNMHTSAGSIALADSIAAEDSFVAARLRAEGAVLLGKTNMTEWANFMSSEMWSGYSSSGGQVLNPYGPGELFVGGSSSGSGAAIAANLGAAAIGTETSGSIISPANQHCLVGMKPTIGLVSRTGIIPITSSQDSAGPMTRTVTDAAILLGALTGSDERDPATLSSGASYRDYTAFLDAEFLSKARIGVPRFYYRDLDEARLEIIEEAIETMKGKGATIIDPVHLPCEETEWDWNVLRYEFKKTLNDYLVKLPENIPVHSLKEVIAYNEKHAEIALKYGQGTLIWSEQTSGTLTETEYLDSIKKNEELARMQGIDFVLREHRLDAILFLGADGGGYDLAARAGYPIITVPFGFASTGITVPGGATTKGPHGVTFVGGAFSEPTLLRIAYSFEQATKRRFPPKL
ncbi:amidase family protein [Cohnella luojiensis]|uniref:Amidase n=1 Tax=Cohnella luojiensis TaxID=652876 RepID=A0A4Y8M247_9BACL|nr:amidase family protein [Cohnella luojiensis]TFE28559.1 amidase [Cohnella luojiensis]